MSRDRTEERVGAAAGLQPQPEGGPRIVDIAHLVGSAREVIITHQGERYRLRITQNGKLLLTK